LLISQKEKPPKINLRGFERKAPGNNVRVSQLYRYPQPNLFEEEKKGRFEKP
jgi:hypothetical protein